MVEPTPASVTPSGCPAPETLEGVAAGQSVATDVIRHIETCPICRAALKKIDDDNRFLSGFSTHGALPLDRPNPSEWAIEIPGYVMVREIHRGGQGVVYQAKQQSTHRDVAVKVMKHGPFATLSDRARFEREIDTLGRLEHPNIIAVHDAGSVAGFHYFVMSYVDGSCLDEWAAGVSDVSAEAATAKGRDPRTASVLSVFIKVCDAVHAAHLRGVIHRDLKPSNIRVDASGEPHVLDFGLAKSTHETRDSVMTGTGQFVGSLPWASPEQIEGEPSRIDLRTDIYSLGAILYQLLTAMTPFDVGSNLRDALDDILVRDPPRPSGITLAAGRAAIDDELDTIVMKCLAKDRDRRYQSAGDLSRDLRRYLAGEPIEAKSDSAMYVLRKTLRRYRLRVAAAGFMVLMLGVFAVVMAVLYRHSVQLEHKATDAASQLSAMLSRGNIEQGRLATLIGNIDQAEQLLWTELLAPRNGGDGALAEPPGSAEAYWALWGLYRRYPCRRTLTPQPVEMRAATLSDDQCGLWTADRTGVVQRLDLSGDPVESYRFDFTQQRGLPYVSPSGKTISCFDGDNYIIWQRERGPTPAIQWPSTSAHDYGMTCFSRSGNRLATIVDGAAVVWNCHPWRQLARCGSANDGYTAIALSPDERRLAARDRGGNIHLWDIESSRLLASVTRDAASANVVIRNMGELVFSPDGIRLADAWMDLRGRIWNFADDPPTYVELSERAGNYAAQQFSPDGTRLAVGDLEGTLRIFDAQTGVRRRRFVAHSDRIRNVMFAPDGTSLWTAGDVRLRQWELVLDHEMRTHHVEGDSLHACAIRPDGRSFVTGGNDARLYCFDAASFQATVLQTGDGGTISSAAFSPDGRLLAVTTYANNLFLYDMESPENPPRRIAHPFRVSHVRFSGDGRLLATACDDRIVRLWRTADGELERAFDPCDGRIPMIAFDPTGTRLAAAVRDGSLRVWDVRTGVGEKWKPSNNVPLRAVIFTLDGRILVTAGADRSIDLWDVSRRERTASLDGHNQEIYCLDIHSDGSLIASGDSGGVIRLWHLPTRRALATLEGHTDSVMSLRFAPDGDGLLSVSLDGTVRWWDLGYHRKHVVGNLEVQLRRLRADEIDPARAAAWRRWGESSRFAP